MKSKLLATLLFFFLFNIFQTSAQTPVVVIKDQNNTTGTVNIDCNYNFISPKIVRLNATFPDLKSTTNYTVAPINYAPTGSFTAGTRVIFNGEDEWSANINIGFTFCYYGNTFTSINVSDNGIVRFGYNTSANEVSPSSVSNTTPDPSLVRNAIFGGFQDMISFPFGFGCLPLEDCGTVSTITTGIAPFRKCIVNFNAVNHFNCVGINGKKSTFQIILYETTNEIEIQVKDKPLTCSGNINTNGNGNSLIGLNNSDGSLGVAPPNRNTSVFSVTNEAYLFTPSGLSGTTLQWFNAVGTLIGTANPIDVIPTVNTFYTVKVNYALCVPLQIQSLININFDPTYPTAPDLVKNYCDAVAPFPEQNIDVIAAVTDPLNLPGTVITIHNSPFEANNNLSQLPNMSTYLMTSTSKVFYYRETVGSCYVTGKITLNLFQTPQIKFYTNLELIVMVEPS